MTHNAKQARSPEAVSAQDSLQLEALLLARAYLYTLFNKMMGGTPDEGTLDALLGQATADVIEEFAGNSPALAAWNSLLAELRGRDRASLLDAARDEYTRVFIGPANLPASPYEAPYTGAHDMALFQENTIVVRRAYHEHGLRVRREQAVPDDHIALMCAFMAELGTRSLDELRKGCFAELASGLRAQAAFRTKHLGDWLDTYAASVRNSKAGKQHVLYPQLIEAFGAFAKADADFLTEAAYWVENQDAPEPREAASELAGAQQALEALQRLEPFGIQDNQLVAND